MSLLKKSSIQVFGLVVGLLCFGEDGGSSVTDDLKSKAVSLEEMFQNVRMKSGYPASPKLMDTAKIVVISSTSYEEEITEIRSESYWVGFLKSTDEFTGLLDYQVSSKLESLLDHPIRRN